MEATCSRKAKEREEDLENVLFHAMNGDTIVALSTPPGESGIAVVRISGPAALDILTGMAGNDSSLISHKLCKKILRDDEGLPIDEVLVVVMKAPGSYTGEDVVEISCHGSMQVVSDIIEEVLRRGARLAGPGEFTKRAYLSGKLDLAQAEAVADLISAETKLQRRVAIEHLEGGLSRKVAEVEELLLEQLVFVEVSIDFTDEDIEVFSPASMRSAVRDMRGKIRRLVESEVAGGKLRWGIRVTILGPRNSGKSSLYNALLGKERAIVSPIPGTTRDILRERIHIGGFTYYLEDTAGIADTGSEIEAKGISIGRKAAEKADIVLFVLDGSLEWPGGVAEELSGIEGNKTLCVLNKIDLGLKTGPSDAARVLGVKRVAPVSALTGEGLEELRRMVYEYTVSGEPAKVSGERIAVNSRQGASLRKAGEALLRLERALDEEAPAEILSMEIRAAVDACGEVTGRSISENILDAIFDRFCIGK